MSEIISDMDTRNVKEVIRSSIISSRNTLQLNEEKMCKDNSDAFFLDYTSTGSVIFSVFNDEKYNGVEDLTRMM